MSQLELTDEIVLSEWNDVMQKTSPLNATEIVKAREAAEEDEAKDVE